MNTTNNVHVKTHSPEGKHDMPMLEKQKSNLISTTELKLYKSCQLMVDQASRMECSHCFELFQTPEFYDHMREL